MAEFDCSCCEPQWEMLYWRKPPPNFNIVRVNPDGVIIDYNHLSGVQFNMTSALGGISSVPGSPDDFYIAYKFASGFENDKSVSPYTWEYKTDIITNGPAILGSDKISVFRPKNLKVTHDGNDGNVYEDYDVEIMEDSDDVILMSQSKYAGGGSYSRRVYRTNLSNGASETFQTKASAPFQIVKYGFVIPSPFSFYGDSLPVSTVIYKIDWNDGSTSTASGEANVFHSYSVGLHNVDLEYDLGTAAGWIPGTTIYIRIVDDATEENFITGGCLDSYGDSYRINFNTLDSIKDGTESWFVDWGDGSTETFSPAPSFASHVYTSAGTYTITGTMTNGTVTDSTFPSIKVVMQTTNDDYWINSVTGRTSPVAVSLNDITGGTGIGEGYQNQTFKYQPTDQLENGSIDSQVVAHKGGDAITGLSLIPRVSAAPPLSRNGEYIVIGYAPNPDPVAAHLSGAYKMIYYSIGSDGFYNVGYYICCDSVVGSVYSEGTAGPHYKLDPDIFTGPNTLWHDDYGWEKSLGDNYGPTRTFVEINGQTSRGNCLRPHPTNGFFVINNGEDRLEKWTNNGFVEYTYNFPPSYGKINEGEFGCVQVDLDGNVFVQFVSRKIVKLDSTLSVIWDDSEISNTGPTYFTVNDNGELFCVYPPFQ